MERILVGQKSCCYLTSLVEQLSLGCCPCPLAKHTTPVLLHYWLILVYVYSKTNFPCSGFTAFSSACFSNVGPPTVLVWVVLHKPRRKHSVSNCIPWALTHPCTCPHDLLTSPFTLLHLRPPYSWMVNRELDFSAGQQNRKLSIIV